MARQKLFEYAAIFHPRATKAQKDAGEDPKSEIIIFPEVVLAYDEREVAMRVAKQLPDSYMDKLSQVEIIIRGF